MDNRINHEPMLAMYIFETTQLLEQLEQLVLNSEKNECCSPEDINETFRIMHTIKGSSAMMMFTTISTLAHSIEDLFFYLREKKPKTVNYSGISDLVLSAVDFIKVELVKIDAGMHPDGETDDLISEIKSYLETLKNGTPEDDRTGKASAPSTPLEEKGQKYYIGFNYLSKDKEYTAYKVTIFFEDGCEMENIRAFTVVHNLKELATEMAYVPEDIIRNEQSKEIIRKQGFQILFQSTRSYNELNDFFQQTIFLKSAELVLLENEEEIREIRKAKERAQEDSQPIIPKVLEKADGHETEKEPEKENQLKGSPQQSMISVNVFKLDMLMDIVGELVISEAMVIQNPDLNGLLLDNFNKAARQLRKITGELQDTVMSIRMVPLSTTFQKMNRVVRDMCKKLDKEVELKIIGEETEVDKNIIDHISDPLMHLVRNSLDHGIESPEIRTSNGKSKTGTITLEARNEGSDVLIIVSDDGKGLNKQKILAKAMEHGLLMKPETDMTDKEIFNLIFLPGFSTKEKVTEFSGRGVGMDVVTKNIESVGGMVSVDSVEGSGTTITLKIPLTLAVIDGMNIKVGNSRYTIPTTAIKQSFRPGEKETFTDPDGNEMIMVRGACYPILRLHEHYKVKNALSNFSEGILIMTEQGDRTVCLFADELLGQQQVVVKALPNYIRNKWKVRGLSGCTLLGDGSISLILDVGGLVNGS